MRTIQSELKRQGLGEKKEDAKCTKVLRKKENLSKREIEELMGVRRPKYCQSKGSYRSR